jgi:GNAT superfamily N-acetyltransferase
LPAPLVRFLDDEALPSSPFKAVALGDIVDADAPPIRRATPADVARISEIRFAVRENRLADPSRVTPADVAWFIEHPGIWVWDDGGRIVGFAAADPRDATIWALFVDPAHERRGIGRALLDAACGVLRAAGHPFATLTTDPGTRAERFYRAGGWTAVGRNARGEIVFQSPLLMGD